MKITDRLASLDHPLVFLLLLAMALFAFKGLTKAGLLAANLPGPAAIFQ